jgi:hypothetical protein
LLKVLHLMAVTPQLAALDADKLREMLVPAIKAAR